MENEHYFKKSLWLCCFLFTCCLSLYAAADSSAVKPLIKKKTELFPLRDIRLHEGQFKHIQDLDHQYLLTLEPDRLLAWFRREAGLTPKAKPYPGWESETAPNRAPLSGHIMGFYLSSMAMMYATTSDQKIIDKLNYTLTELQVCQKANGNGYLLPTVNGKQIFEDVADGNFTTTNPFIKSTKNNTEYDYWEPVYVLNKIMLGLNSVYLNCHLPLAKAILINSADWFGTNILNKLSHKQVQRLLFCEHGSINESFVQVYQLTGQKKYLDWAQHLNDEDMWVPASQSKDILNGWHANTQIPKFTGFENVYQYTGDVKLANATHFFWNTVVKNRSWVIGGNSTDEHFFPQEQFDNKVLLPGGPESCNSVNMMRLTEALYQDDPSVDKIDYYERVLYNHILANYNPDNGMCVYYTSMRPGHYKVYSSLYDSFWCCTGTGMEAPAKFGQMIYAHNSNSLFVNMFMASTLNWDEKGIKLIQNTDFPDIDNSEFVIESKAPVLFQFKIRQPRWLSSASVVKVNGRAVAYKTDSEGYINLNRTWKNGDRINISLPQKLTMESLSSSNKYLAFLCGPIVLAARVDNYGLTKDNFTGKGDSHASQMIPLTEVPFFAGDLSKIPGAITRTDKSKLVFAAKTGSGDRLEMVPFNQIAFSRYAVYFPHYNDISERKTESAAAASTTAMREGLDKKTVDRVVVGDRVSEAEHHLEAVYSNTGGAGDSRWRDAGKGGYFMYNLKLLPGKQQRLCLVFSANDEGNRIFDVLADGSLLQTIDHTHKIPGTDGGLYPLMIDLPENLIAGKDNITIKLQARRGNIAGGLFDLRILYK